MKAYSELELKDFFVALEKTYDVCLPIALHDGTRSFGKMSDGALALKGGALLNKPTGIFSPYLELLFSFKNGKFHPVEAPQKPKLLVGFTKEDLDCLNFIDKFFSVNFYDKPYFNKRAGAVIIAVTGFAGKNGEFLKIADGKCDLELIADAEKYILLGHSEKGKELVSLCKDGVDIAPKELQQLKTTSDNLSKEDEQLINEAARLLAENKVPDEFWQDIAGRCIACTGCTIVCPTCTCFEAFDQKMENGQINRYRLRDSCLLDGFMREASGHNPMAKEFMRTRRRIHHKLVADKVRHGHITCFLCGRCDQVCPSGIGIKSVCREMVAKYGMKNNE